MWILIVSSNLSFGNLKHKLWLKKEWWIVKITMVKCFQASLKLWVQSRYYFECDEYIFIDSTYPLFLISMLSYK
jgi:hypothetical protein